MTNTLTIDQLTELLSAGPGVVYIANFSDNFAATFVSPNIKNQMGYDPEEFTQNPKFWSSHIHEDDLQRALDGLPALFETGKHHHEYRFLHKDGRYYWMKDELTLINDAEGNPEKILGCWTNITELKEANEKLQKSHLHLEAEVAKRTRELKTSELHHQLAIKQAKMCFWRWSFEADKLTSWSSNFAALCFYEDSVPDDYNKMQENMHPNDRERVLQTYLKAAEEFSPFSVEYVMVSPDGKHHHMLEQADIEYDEHGIPIAHIGIVQDITDIKHAEEENSIQSDWLRAILENSPIEIVLKDTEGRILDISNNVGNALNRNKSEFLGATVSDFLPAHIANIYVEADRKIVEMGEPIQQEIYEEIDGTARYSLSAKFPLRDKNGLITGICSLTTDITSNKQTELLAIQAKKAAEDANRTKSEFLANMSHELRTPLNAIIGFSDLLVEETFGPLGSIKYSEYADAIHKSGTHLLDIICDILDISKIEAGEATLEETEIDVVENINSCIDMVQKRAQDANIQIKPNVQKNLPTILGDERHLKQIILNLLSNAVKFTPAGGQIHATAGLTAEAGIEITISDTGIGITPKDIPKVLQPFGQVSHSQIQGHGGTGLGLPICKSLMELHGGTMSLESQLGEGTTVTITFPPERTLQTK